MKRYTKRFTLAVMSLLSLSAPWASAQMPPKTNVLRETDTTVIDEKGDAKFTGRIVFPTEAVYSQVKSNFPNPYVILRNLLGSAGKMELKDATVTYDDTHHALQMSTTMYGAAIDKRNKWRIDIGKGSELLHVDGHTCMVMNVSSRNGMILVDSATIELPASAKRIKADTDNGALTYEIDHEAVKGDVGIDVDMKVKPRLMPALAKIYGNSDFNGGTFWTAKTLFTNSGAGDITHLKISYRIGDYSPWSPATEYSLVVAGGHVVDLYYPLLNKEVTDLKSRTPVDLEVKYTYSDATGKEYSDTTSKRITILGANGFEYSNLPDEERTGTWTDLFSNDPLLAAFVTKMDDPVRAFGGLAARASGGQPARYTDDAAVKFCKALYELEIANGMAYQSAVDLLTENGGVSQELKFPRDVLRDKAGTCIELAILYAAACETVGLKCELITRPGHCYPVVHLPSGALLAIEATAISGPAINAQHPQPYTFDEATKMGGESYGKDTSNPGKFHVVDVEAMWNEGVLVPELSKLPADILKTWGWKELGAQAQVPLAQAPQQNAPAPQLDPNVPRQPAPVLNDRAHPGILFGTWTCNLMFANGGGGNITWILKNDGTCAATFISAEGTVNSEGNWHVEGNRLISNNLRTGETVTRLFNVRGDVLDVQDPKLGNLRFRRAG